MKFYPAGIYKFQEFQVQILYLCQSDAVFYPHRILPRKILPSEILFRKILSCRILIRRVQILPAALNLYRRA